MSILIKNARVLTPRGTHQWVLCADGKIRATGIDLPPHAEETIDAQGLSVLPGFIDLHVHGGNNYEAMDAEPEALRKMAQFYARHGVTAFLATTWTDSHDRIHAALETIASCMGRIQGGATLLGAHLEGPYINAEKGGAQNNAHIRRAKRAEAITFLDMNVIRLIAIAPEFTENHWLIEECKQRGITVSIAHTAATYDDVLHAVALGATQSTHTFNAQSGLHHREPGVVGAVLTSPEIRCELIADNVHVHPAVMNLLYLTKGADGIILITDAVRCAGMPDGDYTIDDRIITVTDSIARLPDGTLAGSTLTMDRALYTFMQATGASMDSLWRTTSLNAAQAIGIADRKGSIEPGKDADLTLVNHHINVYLTIAEGQIVYRKEYDT